eukprot:334212-Chlamydomonas_euryale.AAC.2
MLEERKCLKMWEERSGSRMVSGRQACNGMPTVRTAGYLSWVAETGRLPARCAAGNKLRRRGMREEGMALLRFNEVPDPIGGGGGGIDERRCHMFAQAGRPSTSRQWRARCVRVGDGAAARSCWLHGACRRPCVCIVSSCAPRRPWWTSKARWGWSSAKGTRCGLQGWRVGGFVLEGGSECHASKGVG